jgi:hypothetical protein
LKGIEIAVFKEEHENVANAMESQRMEPPRDHGRPVGWLDVVVWHRRLVRRTGRGIADRSHADTGERAGRNARFSHVASRPGWRAVARRQ